MNKWVGGVILAGLLMGSGCEPPKLVIQGGPAPKTVDVDKADLPTVLAALDEVTCKKGLQYVVSAQYDRMDDPQSQIHWNAWAWSKDMDFAAGVAGKHSDVWAVYDYDDSLHAARALIIDLSGGPDRKASPEEEKPKETYNDLSKLPPNLHGPKQCK